MVKKKRKGSLTEEEKRVAKSLLAEGWRNQDIHELLNRGRNPTINIGRISDVKRDKAQKLATEEELGLLRQKKETYDLVTGLNEVEHERLMRSREAMVMAVSIFNSPHLKFRAEQFAILSIIAWTYLLHEYYESQLAQQIYVRNKAISLHAMITGPDCPLSESMKENLNSIRKIRNAVEHRLAGRSDGSWLAIFQACCVNYEKTICKLFGKKMSLEPVLGYALQFARIDLDQMSRTQDFSIPAHIQALDAKLNATEGDEIKQTPEYKFQIAYTFDASNESSSHIRFISPESTEGKNIRKLFKRTSESGEKHIYRPGMIANKVSKSVKGFNTHCHTLAWKKHKVRPATGSNTPRKTDLRYCIYNPAHNDYTYTEQWAEFLKETYNKPGALEKLRRYNKAKN